jgi:hypothetical protein
MKEISAALVKAQKAFGPALKTGNNPAFRTKYAKLENCIEAVIDALNDNGIMLMQQTHLCEDGVIVETTFLHESGEMLSAGKLHVPAAKHDPQGYGSALTYAKRYSLQSACAIAPEDDDGEAAMKQYRPQEKPQQKPVPQAKPTEHRLSPPAAPVPPKMEGKEGPWQLKVEVDPGEGAFQAWAEVVMDATKLALEQAQSYPDVMAIFRTNANIYKRMEQEPGSNAHAALLEEFKAAKIRFETQKEQA